MMPSRLWSTVTTQSWSALEPAGRPRFRLRAGQRAATRTLIGIRSLASVSRYAVSSSSSSRESFIAGISAPGLSVAGSSTQARRFSGVLRATPAPIVRRLIRCVRSGPNMPLAGVPRTVWQLMHASEANSSRPGAHRGIVAARAPAGPPPSGRTRPGGGRSRSRSIQRVLRRRSTRRTGRRRCPGVRGSIHTRLVLFGITSIFPASCGTQKLWITSAGLEREEGRGGLGRDRSPGTCSSLAVTIPSFG